MKRRFYSSFSGATITLALGACWLLASGLQAQQTLPPAAVAAMLQGEVVDRDGEVCEGAQVELRSAGAPVRSTISGGNGDFSFDRVPSGKFEIQVIAIGFATQTVRGTVNAGQTLALLPIMLTPTTTTSEVRVSADPLEVATEELRDAEKQRVLGIVPNFYVIYDRHAPPLSSRQKYQLAARVLVDPYTVLVDGATAGLAQANDDFARFGNGTAGYMRRFGAVYGDDALGTMLGGAVFPSLLHQDPRYFWKGTGSKTSRFFYAVTAAVICKSDTGRWQANYSSFAADFTVAGIEEAYYPENNRRAGVAITESVGLAKVADAVENVFQEFVARHFTRKAPTYINAQ